MAKNQIKVAVIGDASGVKKALGDVDQSVKGLQSQLGGFAQALGGAFAVGKVVNFARGSIKAAGDLGESINKTEMLFENAAGSVIDFSETAAKELGQSRLAAMDAASTFAVFGKAAGKTGQDLATFSTELVTLSSDLASFHNTRPEEAVYALGAALRGEYEPARRFGYQLNAIEIGQKAMAMGLWSGTGAIDAQAKTLAVAELLYEQAGDAVGDFSRTADSATNAQRILAAQFEEVKISLGQSLMPAFTLVLNIIGPLLTAFNEMDPVMKNIVLVTGVMGAGFVTVVESIEGFTRAMHGLWQVTQKGTIALGAIGLALAAAAVAYGVWSGQQQKAKELAKSVADAMQAQIDALLQQEGLLERLSTGTKRTATAQQLVNDVFAESKYMTEELVAATKYLGLSYNELFDVARSGEEGLRSWTASQLAAKGASAEVAEELAAVIAKHDDLDALLHAVHGSTLDFTTSNMDLVTSLMEVRDAQDHLGDSESQFVKNLMKSIDVSGDFEQSLMRNAEAATGLSRNTEDLGEAQRLLGTYLDLTAQAAIRVEHAQGLAAAETKYTAEQLLEQAEAAKIADKALGEITSALGDMTHRYDAFNDSIGDFRSGQTSALESLSAYHAAVDGLSESVKENRASLDLTTAAGRENQDAILALGDAIQSELSVALKQSGGDYDAVRKSADLYRLALIDQMKQHGFSEEKVNEYVDALGLTPEDVETAIKLSGQAEAMAKLQVLQGTLDQIEDKDVVAQIQTKVLAGDYAGAVRFAQDYFDRNPLRIQVFPKMQNINGGRLRRPGESDRWLAHGGPVEAGQMYMVGDQGSRGELFIPSTDGQIIPNYEIPDVMATADSVSGGGYRAAAGGGTRVYNITVHSLDVHEAGRVIHEALAEYERNGGR